jgi:hypothetical protein
VSVPVPTLLNLWRSSEADQLIRGVEGECTARCGRRTIVHIARVDDTLSKMTTECMHTKYTSVESRTGVDYNDQV